MPDDKLDADRMVTLENAVSDVLARLAIAAVDRARELTLNGALEVSELPNLGHRDVDELCRPIFERAGMLDDFMPCDERFPNLRTLELEDELVEANS